MEKRMKRIFFQQCPLPLDRWREGCGVLNLSEPLSLFSGQIRVSTEQRCCFCRQHLAVSQTNTSRWTWGHDPLPSFCAIWDETGLCTESYRQITWWDVWLIPTFSNCWIWRSEILSRTKVETHQEQEVQPATLSSWLMRCPGFRIHLRWKCVLRHLPGTGLQRSIKTKDSNLFSLFFLGCPDTIMWSKIWPDHDRYRS